MIKNLPEPQKSKEDLLLSLESVRKIFINESKKELH